MDNAFEVPDQSDWLATTVPQLSPVESALRCQVCKDFFDTPMITSCSHTFCSLCIRRCLTGDGRCPACRILDQESRLRRNWIVQELVDAFKAARPMILQLGQHVKANRRSAEGNGKRKLDDTDIEEDWKAHTSRRTTRSRTQRRSVSLEAYSDGICHDEEDGHSLIGKLSVTTKAYVGLRLHLDDGLTACPICNARMKEEAVFTHLDLHSGADPDSSIRRKTTRCVAFLAAKALR